jgi:hypothetical protein
VRIGSRHFRRIRVIVKALCSRGQEQSDSCEDGGFAPVGAVVELNGTFLQWAAVMDASYYG